MKKLIVTLAATATAVAGVLLPITASVADTVGIDPTFGDSGLKTMAILGGADEATAALVQPDGKIIVTGPTSYPDANGQWFMIRTDANGKNLDPSFGNQNIWGNTFFQGDVGKSYDAALAPDGSIFVAGNSTSSGLLMKVTSAGKTDTSFGTTGKVTVPAPGGGVLVLQKVVVANNTVTVAGVTNNGYTLRMGRFNLNGTPVAGFGTNGISDVNLTVVSELAVKPNVSLQIDGSNRVYVLVGNENVTNGVATQLVRINTNGTRDVSYGGVVGDQAMHGRGLVLFPNGTAAAGIVDWKTTRAALQMFDTDGKPTTRTPVPTTDLDYPRGLTKDASGRLLLAARGTGSTSAVKIFGFSGSGAVDTNFANSGAYVYTNNNANFIAPNNITVDSQGRLLVPGAYTPKTGGLDAFTDVAVYRFKVTVTPTPSPSASATPSPSASATPSPSASATPSPSASATPSPSASATPTRTPTPSASPTPTVAGPVVVRPSVQLGSPAMVKAKSFTSITGTAAGTKVSSVQVSVRRIDKKKEKKGVCFFLGATGRMQPFRAPAKSCAGPLVAINATGTKSWMVGVAPKAKPGKYVVSARAIGSGGTSAWATQTITVKK